MGKCTLRNLIFLFHFVSKKIKNMSDEPTNDDAIYSLMVDDESGDLQPKVDKVLLLVLKKFYKI